MTLSERMKKNIDENGRVRHAENCFWPPAEGVWWLPLQRTEDWAGKRYHKCFPCPRLRWWRRGLWGMRPTSARPTGQRDNQPASLIKSWRKSRSHGLRKGWREKTNLKMSQKTKKERIRSLKETSQLWTKIPSTILRLSTRYYKFK